MKKLSYLVSYILFVEVIIMLGCSKQPINGQLEQHWRIDGFTVLTTNEFIKCERMFMGITRMVTEVSEKQGTHNYGTFIARTEYQENETILVLKDFKTRESTGDTGMDATVEQLKPFGINNPQETRFYIKELTHKHLILESDYARLELTKF